ncbi:MAG: DUF4919 domain-containing protein [Bacteroidota bacterium]
MQTSSLDVLDLLVLYYGSAYTENYSPYGEKLLIEMIEKSMEEEKYEEAIQQGLALLKDYPASAELYYNVSIAYLLNGDTLTGQKFFDNYASLISIPFFSGNGIESDSAFVVRCVADEYLIMQEMGYEREEQSLIDIDGIPYDLMKVVDEDGNKASLYFNIYQPYVLGMKNMFDEKNGKKNKKQKKKQVKRDRKKEKKSN